MEKYERVREKLAEKLADWDGYPLDKLAETDDLAVSIEPCQSTYYKMAAQILSLDGIEVKSDDQSLPSDSQWDYSHSYECGIAKSTMDTMLKPDSEGRVWIKVIPKPKRK